MSSSYDLQPNKNMQLMLLFHIIHQWSHTSLTNNRFILTLERHDPFRCSRCETVTEALQTVFSNQAHWRCIFPSKIHTNPFQIQTDACTDLKIEIKHQAQRSLAKSSVGVISWLCPFHCRIQKWTWLIHLDDLLSVHSTVARPKKIDKLFAPSCTHLLKN